MDKIISYSLRYLKAEQKFSKYQWIKANIVRDERDPRPESHKLVSKIIPLGKIGTDDEWHKRKSLVLKNVYTDLTALINEARDVNVFTSLTIFKPARIIAFKIEKDKSNLETIRKRKALEKQLSKKKAKMLADKVPYKFYYIFKDELGKRSRLQIIDWEIYQLCRKLILKYGKNKAILYKHLKTKYFDEFTEKRDIYLFLGTNKLWHIRRSNNPFMIIGVFYPPKAI